MKKLLIIVCVLSIIVFTKDKNKHIGYEKAKFYVQLNNDFIYPPSMKWQPEPDCTILIDSVFHQYKGEEILFNTWVVFIYVDSKNAFGAMIRNSFIISFAQNGVTKEWLLLSISNY